MVLSGEQVEKWGLERDTKVGGVNNNRENSPHVLIC